MVDDDADHDDDEDDDGDDGDDDDWEEHQKERMTLHSVLLSLSSWVCSIHAFANNHVHHVMFAGKQGEDAGLPLEFIRQSFAVRCAIQVLYS